MAQATFSIRMDEDLKRQFDKLCSEFGMNTTTAFNVFARAVVRQRKIPFEIASLEESNSRKAAFTAFMNLREESGLKGLASLSEQEIEAEIQATRSKKGE